MKIAVTAQKQVQDRAMRMLLSHCRSLLCGAFFATTTIPSVCAQDASPPSSQEFDLLIKDGTVYDGTGGEGHVSDVAIRGDRIAGIGDFKNGKAKNVIDARGLAVAPGFINMLSLVELRARAKEPD